jgi:hypothetical protein
LARAAGYGVLEAETGMLASSEADAQAMMGASPDSPEWHLRERIVHQARMGHELRFILTPAGSRVAARFAEQIRDTHAICSVARQQEVQMLDFASK